MNTEEGEEVQVKGIGNIFNKIIAEGSRFDPNTVVVVVVVVVVTTIAENLPIPDKEMPIQMASRTPNRYDQSTASPRHIRVKKLSIIKQGNTIERCKEEMSKHI
jgi:hypothetical protein